MLPASFLSQSAEINSSCLCDTELDKRLRKWVDGYHTVEGKFLPIAAVFVLLWQYTCLKIEVLHKLAKDKLKGFR